MVLFHTFPPRAGAPEMKGFAEKLYSPQLLPLQQAGDVINTHYAAAGIAVVKNGETMGRLILYAGTGIHVGGKKALIIGNYECVNDTEAAKKLLEVAEEMARMERYAVLLGPMNGTTWDTYRFCTNPEAGMFFSEMVHQPHYPQQWKDNGFAVLAEYASTIDRDMIWEKPVALERERELHSEGLVIRNIDLDNYESELERMFVFCERAFRANFLYTPTTWEAFREKYIAVKKWILPEAVFIAEKDGGLAGFCFCIPDHLCATEKRLVLKTIARDNRPDLKGLGMVLGNCVTRFAKTNGYSAVIHALMHLQNYSVNLSGQFSGQPFKQYELYSKQL